ncbi:MAG: MFS transporter [Planctomycetota bacterium]
MIIRSPTLARHGDGLPDDAKMLNSLLREDSISVRERRAMRLSLADGLAYAVMIGCGESYILANANHLDATATEIALVVSLPLFVGALGPALALLWLRRHKRRKPLVAATAFGQGLIYFLLAALIETERLTPFLLIVCCCANQVLGQACGTTWASWIGELISTGRRGRYFALRTRAIHFTTLCALAIGGLVLYWIEPQRGVAASGAEHGFALLYACACAARLLSTLFLLLTPEPAAQRLPRGARLCRYFRTERGGNAGKLLLMAALINFTVYLSSPFFGEYMLDREALHFSNLEYMLASAVVVLLKVLALPRWGMAIDRYGGRQVYVLAAFLVACVPLPWIWSSHWLPILLAQAFSGFAWASYEVALFTLLLDSTYRSTRLYVFSLHHFMSGTAQLLGGISGAWLLSTLHRDFPALFAVSSAARFLPALAAPYLLRTMRATTPIRRRDLLLRVIGLRPNGGLVHRPLPDLDDAARPSAEAAPSSRARARENAVVAEAESR